mmetsp:Transcript_32051/g.52958  ORF Transcript_32051/g.52958 Transcript_32051/m.52958 type:complete len:267 (+) Transcript_32051:612-1412(+)
MHITERSGNGEHGGNLHKSLVRLPNFLWCGVQILLVNVSVVNTIFFTSSDTEFHLEQHTNLGKAREVVFTDGKVLFEWLFRQVNHVRREKRLTVILVVTLRGSQQTVDPREKLLSTVVGVENNWDTVLFSHSSDMESTRDGTGNGGAVVSVVQSLSTIELGSTRGELDDNRGVVLTGSLKTSIDTGGRNAVDGRDSVTVLFCVFEQVKHGLTSDNTSMNTFRHVRVFIHAAFLDTRKIQVFGNALQCHMTGSWSKCRGKGLGTDDQ